METLEPILRYFPEIENSQVEKFKTLDSHYKSWNQKINLISRKDINNLYLHHVLHSLGIAKVVEFKSQDSILDVGTGGGFPGIPLAILFPNTHFHLIDSVGKKIKVVREIASELQLTNITADQLRIEDVKNKYQYAVSRAVKRLDKMVSLCRNLITTDRRENSLLCLKGGDLSEELKIITYKYKIFALKNYFEEPFFETKSVVRIFIK